MSLKRMTAILIYITFIFISVFSIYWSSDYVEEYGTASDELIPGLMDHQLLVVAAGVLLTFLVLILKGRLRTGFLMIYLFFIAYMTFAFREAGYSRGQFEVFWSYKQFFSSDWMRLEILNNIWLFVPLGAALYAPGHRFRWMWAVLLSILIEFIQFETGTGLCEIDDVISNTLGAIIGFLGIYGFSHKRQVRKS